MFENLSERLGGVFDRLTRQGALSEEDVRTAMREVRVAIHRDRVRCIACSACCSTDLTRTGAMSAQRAASSSAQASAASVLLRFT